MTSDDGVTPAPGASGSPEFRAGDGKISGTLAVSLGWLGLGAVLALHFPQYLSAPDLRTAYPMPVIRGLIDAVLAGAAVFGVISLILSRRKSRGLLALGLAGATLALGGSRVPIDGPIGDAPYVALDWFLLKIFVLALLFVPLERLFARVDQRVFRAGWRTDLAHFGASHLLIQATVLLTMVPAAVLFHWAVSDRLQAAVASQPLWLQFVEALVVADLFAYGAHRLFHAVPWLWRFHAIHHSSERLDWLAGSRLHIVDIVVTRAAGFVPLYVLGFAEGALYAYLTWASFHAVFVHANVRFTFGPLRYVLATPQFHHWHHSATEYNHNYAVHLPLIDRIFGTYHLPGDAWPGEYGIAGRAVPEGYLRQLAYPFRRRRRRRRGPPATDASSP
jgi:sterol desaturase/sphingolipid hydroxylase (fatty acid hydroxylase superfamily)